jgi:predicted nucleic acid-binding protein
VQAGQHHVIVVSDTSPVNYLVMIEAIGVLPQLYHEVYIPRQVIAELEQHGAPAPVRRWVEHLPEWAQVRNPAHIDAGLRQNKKLDEGEIHAIALAQELKAHVLIDERDGYEAARARGLTSTGILGVLDTAAERGFLDLKSALARLAGETNFRYSQPLIDRLLERNAQRRQSK